MIATITNCDNAAPGNCTFQDSTSAGTGFSTMKLYNYMVVAEDSLSGKQPAMSQRFRTRYLSGGSSVWSTGASFRLEPRLRKAAVFLVDEAYQQAQSRPQIMVHVPMDLSGLDHDFFIHKYEASSFGGSITKGWQTFIKGIWDKWKNTQRFIVTGSARLDIFRKGGDSMLGRYHYYRIHPFSLPELGYSSENLTALFQFGGFPEPLLAQDVVELRRWHLQRVSKLVRIDLRDLENFSDLDKVELLAESMSTRIGRPFSYKSFAEDLEVSDKTIKRWVKILDSLYYCFLIPPFGSTKIKAVKKSQKLYLWDWSQIEDAGARFENMVASHLLKLCNYLEDTQGYRCELRYIRDEKGREVDFVVLRDRKPIFAVECKLTDTDISPSLLEFRAKLEIPKWYIVNLSSSRRIIDDTFQILPFSEFCQEIAAI